MTEPSLLIRKYAPAGNSESSMPPPAVRADRRRSCCSCVIVFTVFMDGLSPVSIDVKRRSNTRGPATAGPLDESVDNLLWLDDGDSTLDRRVDLWICLDEATRPSRIHSPDV